VKLAVVIKHRELVGSLEALIESLDGKAVEFESVIKMGRTQLQDAVPMTLGQVRPEWAFPNPGTTFTDPI
jgi:aspartate ammonia-lyase|tara:strand:- start:5675 stop:5884 length:210 start_codon:yes stop_codon:yes gene_type:complete